MPQLGRGLPWSNYGLCICKQCSRADLWGANRRTLMARQAQQTDMADAEAICEAVTLSQ